MERAFRGVWIMSDVWLDERLDAYDKVILTEIDSLDQGESGCYASNKYIAEFCQCSESKVSRSVSKLLKLGYIRKESFDGRTRVLKSNLPKIAKQPRQKSEADWAEKQAINIDDYQLLSKDKSKGTFVKPTLSEVEGYIEEKGYHFSATAFWCHYEANGWKVGRNPMKDWRAACATWEHRRKEEVTDDASAKFRGL